MRALYSALFCRRNSILTYVTVLLVFLSTTGLLFAEDSEEKKPENKTATEETATPEGSGGDGDGHSDDDHSRLSDKPIPLQLDGFPSNTPPLFSWPARFLGNGNLLKGIKLPTGAVWQPYLVVFGNVRTAGQFADPGGGAGSDNQIAEWANSANIFANLYLTFTERILIGFQPLQQDGQFTSYNLKPENDIEGFQDRTNFNITTLFFEGDFGELFPFLDKDDSWNWDLGLAVGRQLISFQGGLLINDVMDAAGVTTINLKPPTTINTRVTFLYSWNEINRMNSRLPDENASLFGLLTETDWRKSTVAIDAFYVKGSEFSGDGIHLGFDAVQRMGHFNTTFRVVGSFPVGDSTAFNSEGAVAFFEISRTPYGTHNHLYLNGYYGWKNFRSAARAPSAGGPLGQTGILFAAVGLGRYGAALSSSADESFGSALGYQMFFDHNRKQLILEAGQRYSTNDFGQRAFAAGARYQMAVGTRLVTVLDGFGAYDLGRGNLETDGEIRFGGRLEFLLKL